jgi:hypothetical protein
MSYNNYQTSLWEEFKAPLVVVTAVVIILTGLHNTFYTWLSIDNKKINVAWNTEQQSSSNALVVKENVSNEPIYKVDRVASQASANRHSQVSISDEQRAVTSAQPRHAKNEYVVIDGDISVSAAEFYHPQLTAALSGSDVSGYLEVQSGEVKGLSVQINGDKTKNIGIQMITTGESEIQGNIFVYDIEGQSYTATIYPTSPNEYMVSFVNGPWNGARVKFATQAQGIEQQESQIVDDNSYTAPDVEFVNREWASSEQQEVTDEIQQSQVSSDGEIVTDFDQDSI